MLKTISIIIDLEQLAEVCDFTQFMDMPIFLKENTFIENVLTCLLNNCTDNTIINNIFNVFDVDLLLHTFINNNDRETIKKNQFKNMLIKAIRDTREQLGQIDLKVFKVSVIMRRKGFKNGYLLTIKTE